MHLSDYRRYIAERGKQLSSSLYDTEEGGDFLEYFHLYLPRCMVTTFCHQWHRRLAG